MSDKIDPPARVSPAKSFGNRASQVIDSDAVSDGVPQPQEIMQHPKMPPTPLLLARWHLRKDEDLSPAHRAVLWGNRVLQEYIPETVQHGHMTMLVGAAVLMAWQTDVVELMKKRKDMITSTPWEQWRVELDRINKEFDQL